MNEKALPVLDKYEFEIKSVKRVRGTYYCETDRGLMLLKEYDNSEEKLALIEKLQLHLEKNGIRTDTVMRNAGGSLISQGPDGGNYILKRWYEHRECEPDNEKDILDVVAEMAKVHSAMENMSQVYNADEMAEPQNLIEVYARHNREMQKANRFVRKMKNKTGFEFELEEQLDVYLEEAIKAEQELASAQYEILLQEAAKKMTICHGNAQYHNFLMSNEAPVMVNYIRVSVGPQIKDLYTYTKKIMEKNQWNIELCKSIVEQYDKVKTISNLELKFFSVMLKYPDKFWKVVNSYINSNKAWVSEKNRERLEQIKNQEQDRRRFLEAMDKFGW